jgi:hypothetical protein
MAERVRRENKQMGESRGWLSGPEKRILSL